MREAVIVDSIRTGLTKAHRGSFNMTEPVDYTAHVLRSVVERQKNLDPGEIDDVIVAAQASPPASFFGHVLPALALGARTADRERTLRHAVIVQHVARPPHARAGAARPPTCAR